jgi:hypothetical protein
VLSAQNPAITGIAENVITSSEFNDTPTVRRLARPLWRASSEPLTAPLHCTKTSTSPPASRTSSYRTCTHTRSTAFHARMRNHNGIRETVFLQSVSILNCPVP